MLGVTTNQNINCGPSGLISSSLEEDMDPLFDNDWLHEHNLDLLFDLFEEEMERKGLDATNTNSSSIFGTSPVTSYLFGTSPSLAPALDIYDLLYFDNQQQPTINSAQQSSNSSDNNSSNLNSTTNNLSNSATYNVNGKTTINNSFNNMHGSNKQQVGQNLSTNHISNSISNAMRIKRRSKKGQNEGVSLLARPLTSNSGGSNNNDNNYNITINNKNKSDKTSTKVTNLKKSIMSHTMGIDINNISKQQAQHNRNRHLHHYHHHVHYITGCAVIREHAYAVRGH